MQIYDPRRSKNRQPALSRFIVNSGISGKLRIIEQLTGSGSTALPCDRRQSLQRQVRQHQSPTALQRRKRAVRPSGFPPPPWNDRNRIQEHPNAPHETDAG